MKEMVPAAVRLYAVLLYLYPPAFRRAYREEMVQVFRTSCRQTLRRSSWPGLTALWLRTARDLTWSAAAERVMMLQRSAGAQSLSLYLAVGALAAISGYAHIRGDADQTAILLLLGGSFLSAIAQPRRAARLALVMGCGIPGVLLTCHVLGLPVGIERDVDLPLPLPFVPALIGAYAGVLTRWMIAQLWALTPLARREIEL